MTKFLFFIFTLLYLNNSFSQDSTKLNIGNHAPNLVLPTALNTIQSFSFPYNKKIAFVYFWSSSVANSKNMLYKFNRLNTRYSGLDYKTAEGFELITIALQSDRTIWTDDLIKHNLTKLNNCIALKGFKDYFVKPYKLSETPSSFIIDEKGNIVAVNPDLTTLMNYLDEKKNTLSTNEAITKVSGKILIGDKTKPLQNEKIYLLNDKKDTIQTLITNEQGNFYGKDLPTAQNLNINVGHSTQINDEKLYLASENGEIIGKFDDNEKGFEYKLLDVERVFMKPLKDTEVKLKTVKEVKDLYFKENLFKSGGADLSADAKYKLNFLVDKMKANNKLRVEITTHTDCKGDSELNQKLSLKRATALSSYFVYKTIAPNRIKVFGKGETEPINSCIDDVPCTDAELEINRRSEFKFFLND